MKKLRDFISKILKANIIECDHIYFPEYGLVNTRKPLGQRCCLCDKFNSMEDMGLSTINPRTGKDIYDA